MPVVLKNRIPQIQAALPVRVGAALVTGAETIVEDAKVRVPVESGELQEAIHTEPGVDGVYVVAGNNRAFYGHMVEFGTHSQPPRPFLIPAAEARKDDVAKTVSATLQSL